MEEVKSFFLTITLFLGFSCSHWSSPFSSPGNTLMEKTWSCLNKAKTLEQINLSGQEYSFKKEEVTMWFNPKGVSLNGIALVVHGLNLRPSKMNEIVTELQHNGIQVLRVSLDGHRGNYEEMKLVSPQKWLLNIAEAYCLAKEVAEEKNVPLYFVGYSLGALLSLEFMNSETEEPVHFDKLVYFAPALSLRWYTQLIKSLYVLSSKSILNSWNPENYRANKGSSIAAYRSLFELQEGLVAQKYKNITQPILVFIDPKDELISYNGILDTVKKYDLKNWEFVEVQNQSAYWKKRFHHLIIDQDSMGAKQWRMMMDKMIKHFNVPLYSKKAAPAREVVSL